jgi:hypothetical protein
MSNEARTDPLKKGRVPKLDELEGARRDGYRKGDPEARQMGEDGEQYEDPEDDVEEAPGLRRDPGGTWARVELGENAERGYDGKKCETSGGARLDQLVLHRIPIAGIALAP